MQYSIHEWADGKASLIAEDGCLLSTFGSTTEAILVCIKECRTEPLFVERYRDHLEKSSLDSESYSQPQLQKIRH